MSRNEVLVKFVTINLVIFCASVFSSAQINNGNALVKFETGIESGNYAAIERDLLNYVISNQKDARGFELLARVRFGQNRLNEAKSLYQKALSLDQSLTSAKIDLAVVNFQIGNLEEATSLLNNITDKDVTTDKIRMMLAEAFVIFGDCPKALNAAEKFEAKVKNSDALPLRAKCFFENGETEKINSLIPFAKDIVKEKSAVSIKFARVLSNGKMYRESAEVASSVVSSFPQNAEALILLAKSEIYTGNFIGARTHLNQAGKIESESEELFFVHALLESEQGNDVKALEFLERSLAIDSNSTEALSQFVLSAMRSRYAGKAVKAAEKLLELKPNEPEFLYLFGAASLQNNNLQNAESALKQFLELRPKDSRGCLALGLTYAAQTDKLDAARKQMENCLAINPNNFEATYQLGLSYKTQGESQKAVQYLEETVKLAPEYASALRDLGSVYLQIGAEGKARIVLEKSAALAPNDADTHFQLSRMYNLIGESDLAKKHLQIFQKMRNPDKNGM